MKLSESVPLFNGSKPHEFSEAAATAIETMYQNEIKLRANKRLGLFRRTHLHKYHAGTKDIFRAVVRSCDDSDFDIRSIQVVKVNETSLVLEIIAHNYTLGKTVSVCFGLDEADFNLVGPGEFGYVAPENTGVVDEVKDNILDTFIGTLWSATPLHSPDVYYSKNYRCVKHHTGPVLRIFVYEDQVFNTTA